MRNGFVFEGIFGSNVERKDAKGAKVAKLLTAPPRTKSLLHDPIITGGVISLVRVLQKEHAVRDAEGAGHRHPIRQIGAREHGKGGKISNIELSAINIRGYKSYGSIGQ